VSRPGCRLVTASALTVLAVVALARPAGAVTPRPTDDRSQVTAVEPAGAATATVLGGDTLVQLTVEPGHEVVVLGYAGEPYLRVPADGSVEVNPASAAVSLNRSRDATLDASAPTPAGQGTEIDWQPYQPGRTAVWHDHRIHTGTGAPLDHPVDWEIPITVDGTAGTIAGRLERLPSPSPVPELVLAAAVAGALFGIGRRRPIRATALALGGASVIATVTGLVEWWSLPAVVPRNPGLFLLPVAAAVALLVGLVVRRRPVRLVALLVSISALSGWIAFRWGILDRAVLISTLAPAVDRVGLALVLGATVGAAGLVVSWAGTVDPPAHPQPSPAGGVQPAGRARAAPPSPGAAQ
jgi:hypothetical protein